METIVTGTPGNGKTAHVIDLVWFDKSSIWYTLDKYVDGIAELKLEHFEFPDVKTLKNPNYQPLAQVDSDEYAVWLPDNPRYSEFVDARNNSKTAWDLWFLWATPNSVLIIDEAQRYLRPRPAGSAVPLSIQMIEYHRHFAIHLIFITQKERLLHSNVRMLAGQHIHLTNGWRGGHRFEWPECKDSESKSEKRDSAHQSYKVPKHVFPYYKSTVAVLSTKHKKPFFVYMMMVAALSIPLIFYYVFYSFTHKAPAKSAQPVSASVSGKINTPAAGLSASGVAPVSDLAASGVPGILSDASASSVLAAETENYLKQFRPVVPARPESAHAFDALRVVSSMPSISGCVQSEKDCRCYTQQASRIYDITRESCIDYLAHGVHFDPYRKPDSSPSVAPRGGFKAASVAPSGGDWHIPTAPTMPADRTKLLPPPADVVTN